MLTDGPHGYHPNVSGAGPTVITTSLNGHFSLKTTEQGVVSPGTGHTNGISEEKKKKQPSKRAAKCLWVLNHKYKCDT